MWGRRPNPVHSDEYVALRDVLVAARKASGLTQRGLARALGKANSHVCMIERGQRRVDTLEFCLIARALRIPPDELLARFAARLESAGGTIPVQSPNG